MPDVRGPGVAQYRVPCRFPTEGAPGCSPPSHPSFFPLLRRAASQDSAALVRLAQLDSAPRPSDADAGRRARRRDRRGRALRRRPRDRRPFRPTAALVELLHARVRLLAAARPLRRGRRRRLRPHLRLRHRRVRGPPREGRDPAAPMTTQTEGATPCIPTPLSSRLRPHGESDAPYSVHGDTHDEQPSGRPARELAELEAALATRRRAGRPWPSSRASRASASPAWSPSSRAAPGRTARACCAATASSSARTSCLRADRQPSCARSRATATRPRPSPRGRARRARHPAARARPRRRPRPRSCAPTSAAGQPRLFEALLTLLDQLGRSSRRARARGHPLGRPLDARLPRLPRPQPVDRARPRRSRPTAPTSCTAATRCARCWPSSSATRARAASSSTPLTRDELAEQLADILGGPPDDDLSTACTPAARATRCSPRSCSRRGSTAAAGSRRRCATR